MNIGLVGTRGIPPTYSGFETLAWELGQRLACRGHTVTVYGRRRWVGDSHEPVPGLIARNLPSLPGKYLDTVSSAAISAIGARRHDAVIFVNAATAFAIPLLKLRRAAPVAINVDGFDWQRRKWGRLGRTWYRLGEHFSVRFASAVIADAEVVAKYYAERHGDLDLWVIPYGAGFDRQPDPAVLAKYGLGHEDYFLYVSRFERENNPDLVARAYLQSAQKRPLVMLGRAVYDDALGQRMQELARDPRVRLLGGVYGSDYVALQSSALAYVQATEVGGTHPALVEAMGAGNLVLARESPEHREVLGDVGMYFNSEDDLRALFDRVTVNDLRSLGPRAGQRAKRRYSWDAVTAKYEELLTHLVRSRSD